MKNRINPVWPLILLLVMLTSACSSTPQRIAYNTLQAASDTVFTSMQVYGGLVAAGKVSAAEQVKVHAMYTDYQAVMGVAITAASGNLSASVPVTVATAVGNIVAEVSTLNK
jgi:hypothetical protein